MGWRYQDEAIHTVISCLWICVLVSCPVYLLLGSLYSLRTQITMREVGTQKFRVRKTVVLHFSHEMLSSVVAFHVFKIPAFVSWDIFFLLFSPSQNL